MHAVAAWVAQVIGRTIRAQREREAKDWRYIFRGSGCE